MARACLVLGLRRVRIHRWLARRGLGALADKVGGKALHGLLDWEVAEILAVRKEWGEVDRSHRKLAHRGSYLGKVWVSPSSARRVLAAHGAQLSPRHRRAATSARKPLPEWVDYPVNQLWMDDTTHFTKAGRAATAVMDLVSRKWLATIVSAEETSTQVEVVFTDALEAEGCWTRLWPASTGGSGSAKTMSAARSFWPSVTTGAQMTSGSTRQFMALHAIAQHFGRPHTPTGQAHIETLFGHIKTEHPHLEEIDDPGVLRVELDRVRVHYNTVRLHEGIGYVTPDDEHTGRGPAIRQARRDGLERARQQRLDYHRQQHRQGSS